MVFMTTGEDTLVPTGRYIQIVSSIFDKNLLKIMMKLIKIEKKYTQDLTTNHNTFKKFFFNLFHKKARFKIFIRRITTVSLLLDFKLQNIQQKDYNSIFTPRFQRISLEPMLTDKCFRQSSFVSILQFYSRILYLFLFPQFYVTVTRKENISLAIFCMTFSLNYDRIYLQQFTVTKVNILRLYESFSLKSC